MTDFNTSLLRVAEKAYNLAARPHVQPSLEEPEYTASADAPRDPTPAGGNSVFSDSSERRAFTSRVRRNCAVSGTGDAAERDDAVLSTLFMCGGEAVWLLDRGTFTRQIVRSFSVNANPRW
jgi:hypothetical protein